MSCYIQWRSNVIAKAKKVKYAQTCLVTSSAVCSNLHQTESFRICMYLNNDPCVIMWTNETNIYHLMSNEGVGTMFVSILLSLMQACQCVTLCFITYRTPVWDARMWRVQHLWQFCSRGGNTKMSISSLWNGRALNKHWKQLLQQTKQLKM